MPHNNINAANPPWSKFNPNRKNVKNNPTYETGITEIITNGNRNELNNIDVVKNIIAITNPNSQY